MNDKNVTVIEGTPTGAEQNTLLAQLVEADKRINSLLAANEKTETLLNDTVKRIADQAKATFGDQSDYPGFVQEVYETINYPVDGKWLGWASVARDVDVELEYEVSVSGYVGVAGNYVDVDGDLDNVRVTATLKDVPGEITDVSDIEDVSDYSEFEQEYEFAEGSLSVTMTLVGISEQ